MKLWPASLFGRVTLIVCSGLALAHAFTVLIILRERGDLGLNLMTAYLGRDVAASVAILDRVPAAERAAWLPLLARQNYRYELAEAPSGPRSLGRLAAPLEGSVTSELGATRVSHLVESNDARGTTLYMPLRLSDQSPLTLVLTPPRPMVSRTAVLLLLLQLTALAMAAWLAVRLVLRPLTQLSDAADALEPGSPQPALPADGPREVAQATRAFNAMQARIAGHLSERMQLLAAISHDLQTPITRMKLRAEQLSDAAVRDKLLTDLGCMQHLVEEGLTYARTEQAAQETPQPVDVHALLDVLVCDAQDAGQLAELVAPPAEQIGTPLVTRVQALRRVVTNLLDNALKFGGQTEPVQVSLDATDQALTICVRDAGPGIPPDQLQAVFEPFYRLEGSRSRDTGGTGLGLAIARQLTQALGGTLVLSNRSEGGLEARLTLPRAN